MDKLYKNTNFNVKIIIEQYGFQWASVDIFNKGYTVTSKTLLPRLTTLKLEADEYIVNELGIKVKK